MIKVTSPIARFVEKQSGLHDQARRKRQIMHSRQACFQNAAPRDTGRSSKPIIAKKRGSGCKSSDVSSGINLGYLIIF
jgi:hypothetical protein